MVFECGTVQRVSAHLAKKTGTIEYLENAVARFHMKTISQLGTGKQPVGTTAYMGRVEHLLKSHCSVQRAGSIVEAALR
ncbi:hypothetical protein ACS0TY_024396 [Phlomoides rotata]